MFRIASVSLFSTLLLLSGCLKWPGARTFSIVRDNPACLCPVNEGNIAVIHFKSDSSEVSSEAKQLINESIAECVALRITENPGLKVLIIGHTDKRGTREYNLDLGEQRAVAILNHLFRPVLEQLNDPEQEFEDFPIYLHKAAESTKEESEKAPASYEGTQVFFSEDDLKNHFCTASKGGVELLDGGNTEEAHAKNRRVVIEFVQECE